MPATPEQLAGVHEECCRALTMVSDLISSLRKFELQEGLLHGSPVGRIVAPLAHGAASAFPSAIRQLLRAWKALTGEADRFARAVSTPKDTGGISGRSYHEVALRHVAGFLRLGLSTNPLALEVTTDWEGLYAALQLLAAQWDRVPTDEQQYVDALARVFVARRYPSVDVDVTPLLDLLAVEYENLTNSASPGSQPSTPSATCTPKDVNPAWQRIKLNRGANGFAQATLDGKTHRIGGDKALDFLQDLVDAKGEFVKYTRFRGPRPDRVFKTLPAELKAIIDKPGRGHTGYRMR